MLPALRRSYRFQGKPQAGAGSQSWSPLSVDSPYDAVQWLGCIDDVWLKDKVGTGTERILNGGPGLQQGRCYDFDGTNDEVTVADAGALRPGTGDFSLSLWVNPDTISGLKVLAGKTSGQTAGTSLGWWLAQTAANKFAFTVSKSGDSSTATSTTTLSAGNWYHIVCVRSSGAPKIYVDGTLEDTGTTPSVISIDGTDTLYFGSENSNSHFDGELFGAALYNDALSADEVTYLYNFGLKGGGTDPTFVSAVGQWLMDEQSGTTAYDSSGNGRDGTLTNGPTHTTQNIHSWHNRYGHNLGLYFPGSSAKVMLATRKTFTADFSLVAEFATTQSGTAVFNRLASPIFGDNDAGIYFQLGLDGGKLTILYYDGAWNKTQTAGTYNDGQWHKVAMTYDDTAETADLWVDGTKVLDAVSIATSGSPGWTGIGRGRTNSYVGQVRMVQSWDRILTADEITTSTFPTDLTSAHILWAFDDGQGLVAKDDSGNDLHGTLENSPAWHFIPKDYGAAGEVDIAGEALDWSGRAPFHAKLVDSYCGDFDGTDDYVTFGDIDAVDFSSTNTFSFSFWVNFDSSSGYDYILSKRGSYGGFWVAVYNGEIRMGFGDGTSNHQVNTGVSLTSSTWTQVVVTYDGDKVRLYFDGALQHTSASLSANTLADNTSSFDIARDNFGGGCFNGKLCDVRIFSDTLTANEAAWLYDRSGDDPATTDLVGWWPFSEGAGTVVYDVTSNANHGTATNITASTFWSASQDKLAYNAAYGFQLSSGVNIPARIGGSVAAGGGSITNPAGCWHNDAESKINFNPYNIPELKTQQIGFDAPTDFDVRASEFTEKDQQWVHRETEIKLVGYTIFRDALTGDDRDDAWTYFQTVETLNAEKQAAWKFEDADWWTYATAADVVGSYDATDATWASDNPTSGRSGRMLELYSGGDMAITSGLGTAMKAFTVAGWMNINDLTDDVSMLLFDSGQIDVGFESTTSKFFFTYNGTTIKSTATVVDYTWYHIMAGVDDYGNMTLFVSGDLVNTGSSTILSATVGQWSCGYASNVMSQENLDEIYFFGGKRLTANVASRLNENYISAAGEFANP